MEEKEPKKNDVEEIQEVFVPVTEEEIAERIRNGDYEWTEYDGDDTAHQYDDLTPEELEEKMEELRKKLFGSKKGKKWSIQTISFQHNQNLRQRNLE